MLHLLASRFQFGRHPVTQLVNSAMNVRIVLLKTFLNLGDNGARLVSGRGGIEIDEWDITHQSLVQDGEVAANGFNVEVGRGCCHGANYHWCQIETTRFSKLHISTEAESIQTSISI